MKKWLVIIITIFASTLLTACTTVPMASSEEDAKAKTFSLPAKELSGIYIYRNSFVGTALRRSLYIDDKLIGETAPYTYFYRIIPAGKHKFSTESEFGNNDLNLETQGGKNYFIRQYIKFGVFVGGANLEVIPEEKAKAAITKLKLAK